MTRRQILEILAPPIAFHRCLVKVTGSVNAALMLSQALYWTPRTKDPDGWFYKSHVDWELETGLTRREQDTARKELRARGLVEERLKGVPATLYYRVCFEVVESSLAEYAILVVPKAPNLLGGMRQTSMAESAELSHRLPETTAETTKPTARWCEFWDSYPRKVGKTKAISNWNKLKDEEQEKALIGLRLWKQAEQWNRDNGKYIPYASTFLAQRRWEDEPWTGAFG